MTALALFQKKGQLIVLVPAYATAGRRNDAVRLIDELNRCRS
jgi:hypothetical protein